ncbi:hypothetical protein FCV25MIE_24804 [Fagus crenata]
MEESSAKDVTRETANNPCSFLEEALRAVLKCLGVDAKVQDDSPSSDQKDEKINNGTNTQDNSSTTEQVSDPPSATTDPEADPLSTSAQKPLRKLRVQYRF